MAKLALINREEKRRSVVAKFATKREKLLAVINDQSVSEEERFEARQKFQQLPRNASPVRLRNRCQLTGRPRGVFRKFGLGRNKLREIARGQADANQIISASLTPALKEIRLAELQRDTALAIAGKAGNTVLMGGNASVMVNAK